MDGQKRKAILQLVMIGIAVVAVVGLSIDYVLSNKHQEDLNSTFSSLVDPFFPDDGGITMETAITITEPTSDAWQAVCFHNLYDEDLVASGDGGEKTGDFNYDLLSQGHQAKSPEEADFLISYFYKYKNIGTYNDGSKARRAYTCVYVYRVKDGVYDRIAENVFVGEGDPPEVISGSGWTSDKPDKGSIAQWIEDKITKYNQKLKEAS